MTYVKRAVEPILTEMLAQFPAVALTGPRQAGKSTLLRQMLPDVTYRSLDDPQARRLALDDPELFLDAAERMIVDEVQYIPELLSYIKMRIDRRRDERGRFILTGSQQFHLIKGLGDSLAGRVGILELLPFSVGEACGEIEKRKPRVIFEDACLRGMYPEPATVPGLDSSRWYAAYVQTYLERDVRSLYDVGNLREFERFLVLLAARCGQILNIAGLATDVGVAANTVKRWISILEACRILFLLPPYYNNFGKRVIKSPKVYFVDCGLVCYLTRLKDAGHLLAGPMAGALFENFCVQEALKVFISRGVMPGLFYLRTKNGLELDLLVEGSNGRLCPFEFKLTQTPRTEDGRTLSLFRKEFGEAHPERGRLVCLAGNSCDLSRDVRSVTIHDYISGIADLAR